MNGETRIAVIRLVRVCTGKHVSLEEAVECAKRVLDSQDELRHLCQNAHDQICELEDKILTLKKAGYVERK